MPPLTAAVTLGLAAGGLASLLRALPWPTSWRTRKPLVCSACMGGWSAIVLTAYTAYAHHISLSEALWLVLVGTGIAAFIVQHASPPPVDFGLPGDASETGEVPPAAERR